MILALFSKARILFFLLIVWEIDIFLTDPVVF